MLNMIVDGSIIILDSVRDLDIATRWQMMCHLMGWAPLVDYFSKISRIYVSRLFFFSEKDMHY